MRRICTLFIISIIAPLSYASETLKPIHSYEVGLHSQVIGDLGIPLWEQADIEGTIYIEKASHRKESDRIFVRISTVNGESVKRKILIPLWGKTDAPHNKALTMSAIEKGKLIYESIPNISTDDEATGKQKIITGLYISEWKEK